MISPKEAKARARSRLSVEDVTAVDEAVEAINSEIAATYDCTPITLTPSTFRPFSSTMAEMLRERITAAGWESEIRVSDGRPTVILRDPALDRTQLPNASSLSFVKG